MRKKVIAVVGPTCTGKTALSIKLAKELGGEIISCDSRTIYRYMDIGTAKPTVEERQNVPHFMFDVAEPDQTYTVAQYKECAGTILNEIFARQHVPIVCGGTGLYARALLEGLSIPSVPPQDELRRELAAQGDREGNEALHRRLMELDPVTANRLGANDRFRIIRALEVTITAGKPFSQLIAKEDVGFDVIWIGLCYEDRALLKEVIIKRLDEQIRVGLKDEVEGLYNKYGATQTLMKAVTYRQFIEHATGKLTFAQAREDCITHNYQLARRQLMWFRANPRMNWLTVDTLSPNILNERTFDLVSFR